MFNLERLKVVRLEICSAVSMSTTDSSVFTSMYEVHPHIVKTFESVVAAVRDRPPGSRMNGDSKIKLYRVGGWFDGWCYFAYKVKDNDLCDREADNILAQAAAKTQKTWRTGFSLTQKHEKLENIVDVKIVVKKCDVEDTNGHVSRLISSLTLLLKHKHGFSYYDICIDGILFFHESKTHNTDSIGLQVAERLVKEINRIGGCAVLISATDKNAIIDETKTLDEAKQLCHSLVVEHMGQNFEVSNNLHHNDYYDILDCAALMCESDPKNNIVFDDGSLVHVVIHGGHHIEIEKKII